RELVEFRGIARREETGVANGETHLREDRFCAFCANILGNRSRAGSTFLGAPHDVAEARLPFLLRPAVHAVTERAATAALRGNGPDAHLRIALDHLREHLEARAAEMLGHVLHLNRVAQVWL